MRFRRSAVDNGQPGRQYTTTVAFDPRGNAISFINGQDEQILIAPYASAPDTITYDGNGNLLVENSGGQRTSYTWDVENRLSHVIYPNATRDTSTYFSDGRRFQKNLSSGLISNTVWDGQNALQDDFTTGGASDRYTYSSPGSWGSGADLISQRHGSTTNFYIGDGTSSARALVSAAQAITDTYLYKAFGEELLITGSTNNVMRAFGMFGYQRDAASRLWVRARPLDVVKGRWDSRDPISFGGGDWNLYRYVRNRPTVRVDPFGLACCNTDTDMVQCIQDANLTLLGCNGDCTEWAILEAASCLPVCGIACIWSGPLYLACVGTCVGVCEAAFAILDILCANRCRSSYLAQVAACCATWSDCCAVSQCNYGSCPPAILGLQTQP
jgi:RHS repeat-associated protein